MKKILIFLMVIVFMFSAFAFAQKEMCGKKDMQCCKSCVLCSLDKNVTIENTTDGVLVAIKANIKKIQKSVKECCCFNKSESKNSK